MKTAFFEAKPWEQEYIKNQLKDIDVVFFDQKLSVENADLAKDAQVISGFVDSQISKEMLAKLPNLKMIATRSTGFDHIDMQACKEKNIIVLLLVILMRIPATVVKKSISNRWS